MKFLLPVLITASFLRNLPAADAHWLDARFEGTGGHISVNGFPLFETPSPESGFISELVTGILVDGENTISWEATTPPSTIEQDLPASATIGLFAAPAESPRPHNDPGRPLFQETFEPRRKIDLFPAAEAFLETPTGTLATPEGPAKFEKISERRFALGLAIGDPGRHIASHPKLLRYARLSETLVLGEVHLIDSIGQRQVVFPDLKFTPGGGSIPLAKENAGRGRHHLGSGTFDQIWWFGSAAEGVEEVELGLLTIESFATATSGEQSFALEIPHHWAWQDGEELGDFPPDDPRRESLLSFLESLHQTVTKPDPEAWLPFLEIKIRDQALAMSQEPEAMAENYLKFFSQLTSLDEWALEPFAPARLFFDVLDPRVLRVRYIDSEGPLISVPLPKPGEPIRDRFSIPLYLSLIDGKWTIVR